jgi:hypothetical protein
MPAIAISAFIGAATLAGGLAGLFLQSFLPEKHTTDRSRDMLAAIVGLISLLLALVLGTLIGSAFTFYSTQKSEMETLAARSLQLDLSLAQYGPEAASLRSALRSTLAGIDNVIWGDARSDPEQFKAAAVLPSLRGMVARFSGLSPTTDSQKKLLGAIGADEAQIQQNEASHVVATREPDLLAALGRCRIMVDSAVLWVRNSVETEHHDSRRSRAWIFRDRQRDISHSRIERALQRTVQSASRRDATGDRGTWLSSERLNPIQAGPRRAWRRDEVYERLDWSCSGLMDWLGLRRVCLDHDVSFVFDGRKIVQGGVAA